MWLSHSGHTCIDTMHESFTRLYSLPREFLVVVSDWFSGVLLIIHLTLKMLTVVVVDAGQKPRLVYGEHPKAVVPVTSRNK